MRSFVLRPAADDDAEAATACLRRSIMEVCKSDHQDHLPTLERWLRNKTPQRFRGWLSERDNFMVVATSAMTLCGVGAVRKNGDLGLCYVDPAWQRRGVGSSLLAALESKARAWGTPELWLTSTRTARDFYARHGYTFVESKSGPGYGVLHDYFYSKRVCGAA